jgi:hypothetical protein
MAKQFVLLWALTLVCMAHTEVVSDDGEHGLELTMNPRTAEDHAHLHAVLGAHHRELRLRVFSLLEESVGTVTHKAIDLKNWGYTQFVGTLQIGTPPQSFRTIFDTGSSNTWMPGQGCDSESCEKYGFYDKDQSSTFNRFKVQNGLGESEDSKFYIKYGSGLVKGKVARDDIQLGSVKMKQARFGDVGYETGHAFSKGHFSGIVGLAFPSLAASGMYPLFDQMMDQKVLKSNSFGFFLSNKVERPGKLVLGESGAKKYYKGELTAHDVVEDNYWAVRLVDVEVHNRRLKACPDEGCKLAVDSGTSLLTGPSEEISNMLEKLDIRQDCSNWDHIPHIALLLEASRPDGSKYIKRYPLNKEEYVFEAKDEEGNRKTCTPGLMALDVPRPRGPLWIVGDLFMIKYFTMYSRDKNQVMMGEAQHQDQMQLFAQSYIQEDESESDAASLEGDRQLSFQELGVAKTETSSTNGDGPVPAPDLGMSNDEAVSNPNPLTSFSRIPQFASGLPQIDRKTRVTDSGCALMCLGENDCKAFEYDADKQECTTLKTGLDIGGTVDHYDRHMTDSAAQAKDTYAAEVAKRRAAEMKASQSAKDLEQLKAKHEAVAEAQFESSSILHSAESTLLHAKAEARDLVADAEAQAAGNLAASKKLRDALKTKEKSADAGVEASRTALKVLSKAQISGARKTAQTTQELGNLGDQLAEMLGAMNNGTGFEEVRQKLNDAKNAFSRSIKDQADQNKELKDAREDFVKQLDSYIEDREKQSELATTEVAVNVEQSNRLKRQLAEQIKKNKDKHAILDRKKAEEIEAAKAMRSKAMEERAQAKDVLEKASYEVHRANEDKKKVLAEAAELKKQSQDEAAAMLAEARKQVAEETKKAEEIAEQATKAAAELKKQTEEHNAQLQKRAQENANEMEETVKENLAAQADQVKQVQAVGKAAASDFKVNLLVKAKSASQALIENAEATAATKQVEAEIKFLEQSLEQQRQKMETKLAGASSKENALELRKSMQPVIDNLDTQLKSAKESLVEQQTVLKQVSKVAQVKLIEAGICSYSAEQASKALAASKESCLSECGTIKNPDGGTGERLGCDDKTCSFLCST